MALVFDEDCTPITSCLSINRIIKYLSQYEAIELISCHIDEIFNKQNYPFLTDDFNHVLIKHLGDDKPIETTKHVFELIYNHITSHVEQCDVDKCSKFKRHHRNRETQHILVNEGGIENNSNPNYTIDLETQYYIETMDTIHCFFLHSFDIGYKVKLTELNKTMENEENKYPDDDMDEDDNDINELHKDVVMMKLTKLLKPKKQRLQNINGIERSKNTKFVTNIKTEEDIENTEEKSIDKQNGNKIWKIAQKYMKSYFDEHKQEKERDNKIKNESYSFGYKYDYWDINNIHYIAQKYSTLYEELLNNKIYQIDLERFNLIKIKAKHKKESKYGNGQIMANRDRYTIKKGIEITLQHIMSVLFYTDFNELSFNFSSTFRSLDKSQGFVVCMNRNREYANWSKLLLETVNVFGTDIGDSKVSKYYHGINKLLIFSSFVTVFNSPTSTTAQLEIATIFAERGAILELKKHHASLKYFNCTWLSCYGNEDERLFCCPPLPSYKLQFFSIRAVENNENYQWYIHALTSFDYAITGEYIPYGSNYKVTKTDAKVIKQLIQHYDKDNKFKNKYPIYVNNIFYAFIQSKTVININMDDMVNSYFFMKPLLFGEHILINDTCKTFKNCAEIKINYRFYNEDVKLNKSYFDGILSDLSNMRNQKNKTLKSIELKNVKYDSESFKLYKSKFERLNWSVQQKGSYMKSILIMLL